MVDTKAQLSNILKQISDRYTVGMNTGEVPAFDASFDKYGIDYAFMRIQDEINKAEHSNNDMGVYYTILDNISTIAVESIIGLMRTTVNSNIPDEQNAIDYSDTHNVNTNYV